MNPLQDNKIKAQGTRHKAQGTRDKAQGTRDKAQGTRDKVQGTRHKRLVNFRLNWQQAIGKSKKPIGNMQSLIPIAYCLFHSNYCLLTTDFSLTPNLYSFFNPITGMELLLII